MSNKTKKEIIRVEGNLKEITTVSDDKGKILHKIITPLMVEFKVRDMLQVLVGASLLAIPVGFTEETWILAETLPVANVIALVLISIGFIAAFVHYNYYRRHGNKHRKEFVKRVLSTYLVSFLVVAVLMITIQKAPFATDWLLAFKRVAIVAFPASMSAAVADMIK